MMSASWGKCLDFIHGGLQGSPLLSNIVLDEVDQELEKRGLEFCRFADDCNIFVKSQKAADRVMEKVSQFIEKKLKLKVNRDKSQVAKSDKVKFLGFTVVIFDTDAFSSFVDPLFLILIVA
jgi:retron-type reverse transcriptase